MYAVATYVGVGIVRQLQEAGIAYKAMQVCFKCNIYTKRFNHIVIHTVRPHLAATSLITPPLYSDHVLCVAALIYCNKS